MFPTAELTNDARNKLRQRQECRAPKKLTPPVEWCQEPHKDITKASAAHLVKDIPPAGCAHMYLMVVDREHSNMYLYSQRPS